MEHGTIKASEVDSKFKYGSIVEDLGVGGLSAKVTNLTMTPKFVFTGGLEQSAKSFVLAPKFSCRRTVVDRSTTDCGLGASFGIFQQSTGHKFLDFSIQNIADDRSFAALLQVNFKF